MRLQHDLRILTERDAAPASMDAPRGGFGHVRGRHVGPLTMLLTRRIVVSILAVVVPTLSGLMFVFVGSLKQWHVGVVDGNRHPLAIDAKRLGLSQAPR
jgi:hypothetical protein